MAPPRVAPRTSAAPPPTDTPAADAPTRPQANSAPDNQLTTGDASPGDGKDWSVSGAAQNEMDSTFDRGQGWTPQVQNTTTGTASATRGNATVDGAVDVFAAGGGQSQVRGQVRGKLVLDPNTVVEAHV